MVGGWTRVCLESTEIEFRKVTDLFYVRLDQILGC